MEVSLVMFKSDGTRRDFPLRHDHVVIGRTNEAGLRIPLSSVSRKHCEVRVDGQAVLVRDLGSSNGTLHNGSRVTEATLAAGDQIEVGPVVFTVVIDGQPLQIDPVRSLVDQELVDTGAGMQPPPPSTASEPRPLPVERDADLPAHVEPETDTPTVVFDDDPISALEALAAADDDALEALDQKKQGKERPKR